MLEAEYLKMYIDELADIKPCDEAENASLLAAYQAGDEAAQERLIEGNLRLVPEIVTGYEKSGAPISDMIQEGNMALIGAIRACATEPFTGNFEEYLSEIIRMSIEAFAKDEGTQTLASHRMQDEANRLLSITREFEETNGETATLSQLATLMGMSEDEVENIMRVSYSAMSLGDGGETDKKPASNPLKDGWD